MTPTLAILPQTLSDIVIRRAARFADDFILSPVSETELQCRLTRLLGSRAEQEHSTRQRLMKEFGLMQLVGEAPAFVRVVESIPDIASSSAPALLRGETGTGKELCAQAIHTLSARQAGPFIPVECGAIPEQLVENELFGHARGAFTDAHNDQRGLVALAEGGTLFLDEIDSLSLAAQSKLLRFVQEGTYRPLGAQKFTGANVRLIAATNRDLEKCVREGRFRPDLYFRLNVLPLNLPPLRDRRGDVMLLANHFAASLSQSSGQPPKKFSVTAQRSLESYDWPGNVRELFNVVQRAVAFAGKSPVLTAHIGTSLSPAEEDLNSDDFRLAKSRMIEKFEITYLTEALKKNGGNVTRAASAIGKDRRVFGRLLKKYRIDRTPV